MRNMLLVPLDGSEVSEASLPWAVKLAHERSLTVMLARVVEYPTVATDTWGPGIATVDLYEEMLVVEKEAAAEYLAGIRARFGQSGVPIETTVVYGSPAIALLDLVDQLGVDGVVIASHGHSGLKRLVLGSVTHQLLAHATAPVLVVRADQPERRRTPAFDRLLVPLDGSPLAERALPAAREMAAPGATVILVRVASWPDQSIGEGEAGRILDNEAAAYRVSLAQSYLDRIARTFAGENLTVETQVVVSESKASVGHHLAVAAASGHVDAVVMSTHGRGGMSGWLIGSVADEVVRSLDRPVLLVSARAAAVGATGRQRVGDIMTHDVLTLREDEPLVVALRKLVRRHASGAPVVNAEGTLVGVLSQRDIFAWHEGAVDALAHDRSPTPEAYLLRLRTEPVRNVMTSPATTIAETASVGTALTLLREHRLHRLPVTDNGKLVGIVTGSDVLLALLSQLESTDSENRAADLLPAADELIGAAALEL